MNHCSRSYSTAARILCPGLLFLTVCSSVIEIQISDTSIDKYASMYESDNWVVRKNAIKEVSKYKSSPAVELLIRATYDTHSAVKIQALIGIGDHTPHQALNRVRSLSESAPEDNVKWHSLKTLGNYRDTMSALIFAKNLESEDWLIREESIKGLLKIDQRTIRYISVPYVIKALNDNSISVKLTTLKYLNLKDPRIYTQLSEILLSASENQQSLIEAVLLALDGYILDETVTEKAVGFLTHQNVKLRLAAYQTLITNSRLRKIQSRTPYRKKGGPG